MKRGIRGILFCIIPVLMFVLMEAYEHNPFAEIRSEAFLFNVLLFELIAWIIFFISANAKAALYAIGSISMLFGITNHYVMKFRSTPFVPWDIFSVQTAGKVAGSYDFTPDIRMIVVTLFFIGLFVALHFYSWKLSGKKRMLRVLLFGVLSGCLVVFVGRLQNEQFQSKHHLYPFLFTPAYMTKVNGMAVTFAMNLAYMRIEKPDGYHTKDVEALLAEYQMAQEKSNTSMAADMLPNIIVIMDEAFSDLAVLGQVNASKDYMPFVHRLEQGMDNTITGKLNVSVCGGNTANTEFEFLTGNTMRFLPGGSIPYQQYVKSKTPSLSSHLANLGYATYAMHPYYASGWERNRVYPLLGFRQCIFLEDWKNKSYVRNYISDYANMKEIIRIYEEKDADTPMFLFNVTMQNHGGYAEDYKNFSVDIVAEEKHNEALNRYLSLLHKTDAALEYLVQYFENQEEPTIILFFGDHQPNNSIAKSFSFSDDALRYQVPFLIWANYDIEEAKELETSANYLSTYLLNAAGLPLYDYQYFLMDLQKYYPVLSAAQCKVSGDGNDDMLSDYKKLQYYLLFEWKEAKP